MKIKSISFESYKAFAERQDLELRPITLIFGKNSSGKSSILKLISILSSMSQIGDRYPFILNNSQVSLGTMFPQLFHNMQTSYMSFRMNYDNDVTIGASLFMDQGNIYAQPFGIYKKENNGDNKANKDAKIREDAAARESNTFWLPRMIEQMQLKADDIAFSTDYIGPLRPEPIRNITLQYIDADNIGLNGSNVYSLLLASYLGDKVLFNNVSGWFEKNLDHQGLTFERNGLTSGYYSLCVERDGFNVNLADVGQGVAQVLPIITLSYLDNQNDISIIEQPALHLHPAAHKAVAQRIANSALEHSKCYVIETHSENLLLSFRDLVVDKSQKLTADDIIIYYVETYDACQEDDNIDGDEREDKPATIYLDRLTDNDETESTDSGYEDTLSHADAPYSYLQEISILPDGSLSDWPEGVFGERFNLIRDIIRHKQ